MKITIKPIEFSIKDGFTIMNILLMPVIKNLIKRIKIIKNLANIEY